jgi:hypothetical protein
MQTNREPDINRNHMSQDFATLRLFNEKVDRLLATGIAQRYQEELPEVIAEWHSVQLSDAPNNVVLVAGIMNSCLSKHDQDEIDAFVLTFRMFIQQNDRSSISSLAKVYAKKWMPAEALSSFDSAKLALDEYLDSPILLQLQTQRVTRRQLVDTIVYGGLAHSNVSKEAIYRGWIESGVSGFFWGEFVVTLKDILRYLAFFQELNLAVLENCDV